MDINLHTDTALKLYNTMTRQKEKFEPVNPEGPVGMYNCGPTVYDYQHIGNLRAYVFADILRRTLQVNGYEVQQIINITDVGHLVSNGDTGQDKMTKGLEKEGLPITLSAMKELGEKYATIFKADLKKLNTQKPEHFPKASDHIDEDIALIEILDNKGFTYKTDDGLYFDTSRLDDYGKLAGDFDEKDTQSRVENDQKRNPRDFALWKFDNKLGWSSPWGQGFPGWHIECSVMSMQYLGDSFDIHTGGIDHIPVHHTNEIAQSEAATGKTMARFWLHNDFMTIESEKISKSIGNTLYLADIEKQGYDPLAYRYLLLSAKYRTKMNFSWESLASAANALNRLYDFMRDHDYTTGASIESYEKRFMQAVNDDLNTPEAVGVMWKLLDDKAVAEDDKAATIAAFDQILGLNLTHPPTITIPDSVKKLAEDRLVARKEKDFQTADKLREEINEHGFTVKDTEDGYSLHPFRPGDK